MSRQEIYENYFSARVLFTAGLFILPALLFNPSTEYRVLQFIFFWLLAWLSGKKINPVFTVLIIAFIAVFNLFVPYGRVLFSIGVFKITSGALRAGIHRAVTLEALIMLSKFTIRRDLKIPGAFGALLGESMRLFSALMNRKYRLKGKNFINEVDMLMLELSEEDISYPAVSRSHTKPAGYIVLGTVIVLSWLPVVLTFLII
jgi:heptaprenyl diphosphate synthase